MGLISGFYSKSKGFFLWLLGWEEPIRTPEQIIDTRIQEFTVTLNRCKVQVARLMQEQKQLQDKINRNKNKVTECLREARHAMTASNDDLARDMLRSKAFHEEMGASLEKQMDAYKKSMDHLVGTVRKMDIKIDELKRHRMLLATQKQVAEAQILLQGGSGGDETDVKDLLADLEEQVLQKQAKAMLEGDLSEPSAPLLTEPQTPSIPSQAIENELAELKKRFGGRGPAIEADHAAQAIEASPPVDVPAGSESGENQVRRDTPEASVSGDGKSKKGSEGDPDGGDGSSEDIIIIK